MHHIHFRHFNVFINFENVSDNNTRLANEKTTNDSENKLLLRAGSFYTGVTFNIHMRQVTRFPFSVLIAPASNEGVGSLRICADLPEPSLLDTRTMDDDEVSD